MRCPYCSHDDTKVIDSREAEDGIRRRRECLKCSRRFTTYERVQAAPLQVVKKDGRREEFSRDKILAGVRRSCAKLPVSTADINKLVDEIEAQLTSSGMAEVQSSDLGDIVAERLRELNYVAYVRFVSHYRSYASFDELQQEFARLHESPRISPRRTGAAQPPLPALDPGVAPPVEITGRRPRRVRR